MGVMAGTLDLVQRIYLGTEIRDEVVYFDPRLTDRLDGLSLPMQFRRTADQGGDRGERADGRRPRRRLHPPVRVGVGDDVRELSAGERCTFTIAARTGGADPAR